MPSLVVIGQVVLEFKIFDNVFSKSRIFYLNKQMFIPFTQEYYLHLKKVVAISLKKYKYPSSKGCFVHSLV